MKKLFYLILPALFLVACSDQKAYSPEQLSAGERDALKESTVRYFAKRPEAASEQTKFESQFNNYYQGKAKEAELMFYYSDDNVYYMMISQIAPSMNEEKRHATAIRFKLNEQGEITEYEEVFRTWKMKPDVLRERGLFLFERMVKGESLEPYLTKNSGDVEYIEFPDDLNQYDKASRQWKFKAELDTLVNP